MGSVRLVEEFEHAGSPHKAMVDELQPGREHPAPPRPRPTNRPDLIVIMGTVAKILGFRFQLFCAFLASAGIGAYAVYRADTMSLIAFALYAVLVFLPTLFVAHKRG